MYALIMFGLEEVPSQCSLILLLLFYIIALRVNRFGCKTKRLSLNGQKEA